MTPHEKAQLELRSASPDYTSQGSVGPLVSVIVPHKDDESSLRVLLQSLAHQTFPLDEFEVIVVNNAPTSLDIEGPPGLNLRLECEPHGASYAARNKGIEVADGRFLAFTDADCVAHPDWLREGIEALMAFPSAIVGGEIQVFSSSAKPSLAEKHQMVFAFDQRLNFRNWRGLPTANLFVSADAFYWLGAFNRLAVSGGDAEWTRRALAEGWRWHFAKSALVFHPARSTLRELFSQRKRHARGIELAAGPAERLAWVLKWTSPRQSFAGRLLKADKSIARFKLLIVFVQFGLALSQVIFALGSLVRLPRSVKRTRVRQLVGINTSEFFETESPVTPESHEEISGWNLESGATGRKMARPLTGGS